MENKRTCLYDKHVALGAQMSPFGGFCMPIQYSGIVEEHRAVRSACGVFDVSHMGEVLVAGTDAERYVNHLFSNNVEGMPVGKILYGMMCYEDGGVVDDLLVYKLDADRFLLVINAANIDKDWAWIESHATGYDVTLVHQSEQYGQLAVQGPQAEDVLQQVLGIDGSDLAFYTFKEIDVPEAQRVSSEETTGTLDAQGIACLLSRTGYTGEDGFELYAPPVYIRDWWDRLVASGRCVPCGLGCRDTLRFEVGLPLYGDELSEDITPLMAGLGMFVKLDKAEFIGREALISQKAAGAVRRLVGIELSDKAIPRHGYTVLDMDGAPIGVVTTGYHTISTDQSVCMALVDSQHASLGTPVQIQIRKKIFPGHVVKKQFYNKNYKK